MGWTEVLEELTGERPRLTSVLDACRRLKARLEDAEVQLGTVFRDAGGIDVTGELDLLTSYLDGLDAGDSDQPPVKSQTRLLLLLARAAQAPSATTPPTSTARCLHGYKASRLRIEIGWPIC